MNIFQMTKQQLADEINSAPVDIDEAFRLNADTNGRDTSPEAFAAIVLQCIKPGQFMSRDQAARFAAATAQLAVLNWVDRANYALGPSGKLTSPAELLALLAVGPFVAEKASGAVTGLGIYRTMEASVDAILQHVEPERAVTREHAVLFNTLLNRVIAIAMRDPDAVKRPPIEGWPAALAEVAGLDRTHQPEAKRLKPAMVAHQ